MEYSFFLNCFIFVFQLDEFKKRDEKKIAIIYGINFILNILWSFLYFYMKNPFFAFIEIIFFWFSILSMIILSWKISKKAGYLLIPYLLWVGFAIILNWLSVK